jgi:two-component system, NtrC family, nitrogen regulation response regulator NtrX
MVGSSSAMKRVALQVRDALTHRSGVLVCGEPGTGRESVARAIHGATLPGPFVLIDWEDAPQSLEERLFGSTGTAARGNGVGGRSGGRVTAGPLLHEAKGGTLFLRNVLDAPDRVQAKLARLMRDGEAATASGTVRLDLRVAAAVEPGFDRALEEGRFRADLYKRLSATRIDVPPLRYRPEDIPLLAAHLLAEESSRLDLPPKRLSSSASVLLAALPWRGNIPELRQLLGTLLLLVPHETVSLRQLLAHIRLDGGAGAAQAAGSLRQAKTRWEREYITAVLARHKWCFSEAARELGIQRTNLHRKVRTLRISRQDGRASLSPPVPARVADRAPATVSGVEPVPPSES